MVAIWCNAFWIWPLGQHFLWDDPKALTRGQTDANLSYVLLTAGDLPFANTEVLKGIVAPWSGCCNLDKFWSSLLY